MTTTEAELIRLWRFDCESQGLATATINHYERYLREYQRDAIPLLESTTSDLTLYLHARAERWCPATRMYVRRAFRSFFKFALEHEAVAVDPAQRIKAIKTPVSTVRTPSLEDRLALVRVCETVRDRAIIEMLFGTGMRRGELAALRLDDLNVAERTVQIAKSKNGKPRTAVMDDRAHRALLEWLEERNRNAPDHDWLWTNARGTQLKPDGLKMVARRASVRSNVKFSSHDARRAFAVEWLARGGSETGLMAVAGWSSPTMVARYIRERQSVLAIEEARRLFAA